MKNKFKLFVTLCVVLLALNACRRPASQLAVYIPKDASAVFIIDMKAISDKISSSGITIDSLANIFAKQNDKNTVIWDDIKNSGIDLNKSLYIFSKQANSIQQGNIKSIGLIAEVTDEKKLEDFFKRRKPGGNISTAEKYKYIQLDENVFAGFTNKILIISAVDGRDSTGKETLSQTQLAALFTQKEPASIASVEAFKDVLSKTGDIHFYTNTAANLNAVALPGMSKISTLLESSYTEGTINFEKGKMVASGETHYNKTLSDIIDKYPAKSVNTAMIKNYPGMLTAFGITSFNPKILADILRYLGFDAIVDGFASDIGFTTNDIVNAFSGDIAVMFSSRDAKATSNAINKEGGFLLAAAMGDKAAFDKVITGLLNKGILSKNGDEYQLGMAGGHGFVIETGSNNLFIASSDELIKAYQAGGNKQPLPADVEKELADKSMFVYFDINNFLQNKSMKDSVPGEANDGYYTYNIAKAAKETFKNFIASAYKGNDKSIASNYQLNFVNKNENSLASFTKFIAVAHQEAMKRKGWPAYPPLSGLQDTNSAEAEKDSGN